MSVIRQLKRGDFVYIKESFGGCRAGEIREIRSVRSDGSYASTLEFTYPAKAFATHAMRVLQVGERVQAGDPVTRINTRDPGFTSFTVAHPNTFMAPILSGESPEDAKRREMQELIDETEQKLGEMRTKLNEMETK